MSSHYRRLTPAEITALRSLEEGVTLSEYDALARVPGVRVATDGSDAIVHVFGADAPGLAGTLEAADASGLSAGIQASMSTHAFA